MSLPSPVTYELPDGVRVRVEPRSASGFLMVPIDPAERHRYRWSRHAYLRRAEEPVGEAILDSAVARARLSGAPAVMARLFATGEPLEILAAAGLMIAGDEDPRWEFHDRLFHQQSTRSDPLRHYGATWRLQGRVPPPEPELSGGPAEAPPMGGPLAGILARRRSSWAHGRTQLRIAELRQFLALATLRLPSAGGLDELRFYLASRTCPDLAPGLYRFEKPASGLTLVSVEAERLLHRAAQAWGDGTASPQALIVIAARVPLQAWKYEGIAYRNALLDTGIALEALYLASAALDLAGCALGWCEPEMLATLTGIDVERESAMAAFVVGSRC